MKIRQEHYNRLLAVLSLNYTHDYVAAYREELKKDARVKDLEMRLRWDLLHKALGSRWICDQIYPYADDTHLDTALRAAMRELGF
jgi:hypothetical protein